MLSQDTYRGEKSDPLSLHLYAYCSNDPINFIDPSGHKRQRFYNQFKAKYGNKYRVSFTFRGWKDKSQDKIEFSVLPQVKIKKVTKNKKYRAIRGITTYQSLKNRMWIPVPVGNYKSGIVCTFYINFYKGLSRESSKGKKYITLNRIAEMKAQVFLYAKNRNEKLKSHEAHFSYTIIK